MAMMMGEETYHFAPLVRTLLQHAASESKEKEARSQTHGRGSVAIEICPKDQLSKVSYIQKSQETILIRGSIW